MEQRQFELDTLSDLAATLRIVKVEHVVQDVMEQITQARARIDALDWVMGANNLETRS